MKVNKSETGETRSSGGGAPGLMKVAKDTNKQKGKTMTEETKKQEPKTEYMALMPYYYGKGETAEKAFLSLLEAGSGEIKTPENLMIIKGHELYINGIGTVYSNGESEKLEVLSIPLVKQYFDKNLYKGIGDWLEKLEKVYWQLSDFEIDDDQDELYWKVNFMLEDTMHTIQKLLTHKK